MSARNQWVELGAWCRGAAAKQTKRAKLKDIRDQPRPRAQDIDRHIGARMRERRVMLGLAQQQLAELIGVTYQQAHKYEKGINRISGGRLFKIAQALGVEVGYFYEGLGAEGGSFKPTQSQRLLLDLAQNFSALQSRRHQEAVCDLVRAVVDPEQVPAAGFDFC
jgi:transcriptional regulator with XRE-family HTH domain